MAGSQADGVSVPTYTDLGPVYGSESDGLGMARARYAALALEFDKVYGGQPDLYARAPGRVNLIGEHIDYEGYDVLPMAIRPDTIVAVRARQPAQGGTDPPVLTIANVRTDKYPQTTFAADPSQEVDRANHCWANYILCGYKGVFEYCAQKGVEAPALQSLDFLVDGTVPTGAGLSSSAAIVCSAAIAVMAVHGLSFPKTEVADFCCKCERHIGTQSGGMDQAISLLAQPGVAKLIKFNPVRAHDVPLPPGGTFVIANSLTVSNKAETASTNYNMRVVECRLAAMLLAVKLGWEPAKAVAEVFTLGDVEALCTTATEGQAGSGPVPAVKAHLHPEPYTSAEVEAALGQPLREIFSRSTTSLAVLDEAKDFKLQQRAAHVYAEAARVHEFRAVALAAAAGGSGSAAEALPQLGRLMDDSHSACSELYECSCPELEELVGVARAAGALGSRLTGAGWGGCTVSLVRDGDVAHFIETVKGKFYQERVAGGRVAIEDLDTCIFASKPAGGAAIFRL